MQGEVRFPVGREACGYKDVPSRPHPFGKSLQFERLDARGVDVVRIVRRASVVEGKKPKDFLFGFGEAYSFHGRCFFC